MEINENSFGAGLTNADHKQHLNLLSSAWDVIDEDLINFSPNIPTPLPLSSFLNTIIINCDNHPELLPYPADISNKEDEHSKAYSELFQSLVPKTSVPSEMISAKLNDYYEKVQIKKNAAALIKGTSRKFRLNAAAYAILCNIDDKDARYRIFKKAGTYLKVLFEEYSRLPASEREKIYFFEKINTINSNIHYILKITSQNQAFLVQPHKITTDSYLTHLYLSGYSAKEPVTENTPFEMASFRISRIQKIQKTNQKKSLTKEDMKNLEKEISAKGIAFLLSPLVHATIRFTKTGQQKFQTQSYLRPVHSQKISEFVYEFAATERQLEAYFLKFGKDIEVLGPDSLRNYFANYYKETEDLYFPDKR